MVVGVELIPGLPSHWAKDRGVISEKGARGLGLALLAGRRACVRASTVQYSTTTATAGLAEWRSLRGVDHSCYQLAFSSS